MGSQRDNFRATVDRYDGPGGLSNWLDEAACREVGPEPFYPEAGESARYAKAVCRVCRVRAECLTLEASLPTASRDFGVWGGLTPRERERLPKR